MKLHGGSGERPRRQPLRSAEALVVTSPDESPFIVERDLRPGVREMFIQILEQNRENRVWGDFGHLAVQINFLFPGQPVVLLESDWTNMKKVLDDSRQKHWDNFLLLASSMKELFPDKVDQLGLDEEIFEWLKRKQSSTLALKTLYPKKTQLELTPPELQTRWESLKDELKGDLRNNNFTSFYKQIQTARLAFPEHQSEIENLLDANVWRKLKKRLETWQDRMIEQRQTGPTRDWLVGTEACNFAFTMLILANDSEITPDGFIRVNRPTHSIQKANPLPPRSLAA